MRIQYGFIYLVTGRFGFVFIDQTANWQPYLRKDFFKTGLNIYTHLTRRYQGGHQREKIETESREKIFKIKTFLLKHIVTQKYV